MKVTFDLCLALFNRHKVIISNAAARFVALMVFYVSLRVVLPQHGATLYGAWVTLAACLGVFSFLDFGFGNALIAKLGAKIIKRPTKQDALLVKNSLFVILALSIISILIISIVLINFDLKILFNSINNHEYDIIKKMLLVSLLCLFLQINSNGVTKVFLAIDRAYIAYFTNTFGGVLSIFVLYAFPKSDINLLFIYAFALPHAVTCLLVFWLRNEGFLRATFSQLRFAIFVKQTLGTSSAFTVIQLGAIILIGGDYLIISALVSTSQAGEYAFVQKNAQLFSIAVTVLNIPMWVQYSRMTSGSKVEPKVLGVFIKAALIASLISAFGTFFLLFATNPLAGFVSAGTLTVYFPLVIAMSAWMSVENAGIAFTAFKNGTLMLKQQMIEILGMALFGFAFKFYLVGHIGVMAIPIVSAFTYVSMTFIVYFILFKKETLFYFGIIR